MNIHEEVARIVRIPNVCRIARAKRSNPISLDMNVILYFAIYNFLKKIFYKEINTGNF